MLRRGERRRSRVLLAVTVACLAVGLLTGPAEAAKRKPVVSVRVSTSDVVVGSTVTFSGRVTKPARRTSVRLEVQRGSRWSSVRTVRSARSGRFSTTVRIDRPGRGVYRVRTVPRSGVRTATSRRLVVIGRGASAAPPVVGGGGLAANPTPATPPDAGPGSAPSWASTTTRRLTRAVAGDREANGDAIEPQLALYYSSGQSARVTFRSTATNMDLVDTNGSAPDAFTVQTPVPGASLSTVSAPEREIACPDPDAGLAQAGPGYAAFVSRSTNLGVTPPVGRPMPDIVYTAGGEPVSVTPQGRAPDGGSRRVTAATSGLVFVSDATDLVAGDTNGHADVFSWRRDIGVRNLTGGADGDSTDVASSSSGSQMIAIASGATNLTAEADRNRASDIFVLDGSTGEARRVTPPASNGPSYSPVVDQGGRYVVFVSEATNLVGGPAAPAVPQVYRWDSSTGTTIRVTAGNRAATSPATETGANIVFVSAATDIDGAGVPGVRGVFRWDASRGAARRVTPVAMDGDATAPQVGGSGGDTVVFASTASNLTNAGDSNGRSDVFLWFELDDRFTPLSRPTSRATWDARSASGRSISADGSLTLFQSASQGWSATASACGSGDFAYLHDGASNRSDLAFDRFGSVSLSDDGATFGMTARSSDELPGDPFGITHAYLGRRGSSTTTRIMNRDGDEIRAYPGSSSDMSVQLSGDGRYAVTVTAAINPMGTDDPVGDQNAFLVDTTTGRVTARITTPSMGDRARPLGTAIDGVGRFVAFVSDAPGDPGTRGLYRWDRLAGTSTLLPVPASVVASTLGDVDIDPSGRFVGYSARASADGARSIMLLDVDAGITSVVADGTSGGPSLSDGARFIAYSRAGSTVDAIGEHRLEVFVWDRQRASSTALTAPAADLVTDGDSYGAVISADGRSILFTSTATTLPDADADGPSSSDVFTVRMRD